LHTHIERNRERERNGEKKTVMIVSLFLLARREKEDGGDTRGKNNNRRALSYAHTIENTLLEFGRR
jgi:hypothetical protein